MRQTVPERAINHVAVLLCQFTTTFLFVGLPLTHIRVAVLPYKRALALLVAILELPRILITVGILENSCTSTLAVHIVAFEHIAILELINAATTHLVVRPLPDIHIAIGIIKDTLTRAHVIFPLTVVRRTVAPVEEALSVFLIIRPVASVEGSAGKGINALSLTFVLKPLTIVLIAVIIIHDTMPLLVVLIPQTLVAVIVGKIIGSPTVLVILEPLTIVLLTVGESIDAVAFALTFHILPLVGVAVLPGGLALAMRIAYGHLSLIVAAILCRAGTQRNLLGIDITSQ